MFFSMRRNLHSITHARQSAVKIFEMSRKQTWKLLSRELQNYLLRMVFEMIFFSHFLHSPIMSNTTNTGSPPQLIDYNDTHVLDFQPSLKTLCIFTVVQNNLNQSELPHDILYEIRMMQQANSISRSLTNTG